MTGCSLFVSILVLLLVMHLMAAHFLLQCNGEFSLQSPDVAPKDTGPRSKVSKPRQNVRERLIPFQGCSSHLVIKCRGADPGTVPHLDVKPRSGSSRLRVNLFPVDVILADSGELFHLAPGTALTHWHLGHSGLEPFQLWNRGAGSWDLDSTGDHLQTHTWRV